MARTLLGLVLAFSLSIVEAGLPNKIYGVNLGSWYDPQSFIGTWINSTPGCSLSHGCFLANGSQWVVNNVTIAPPVLHLNSEQEKRVLLVRIQHVCICPKSAFARAYPGTVDRKFNEHWNSWFNQADVDSLVNIGINTVRIPLGYWIVEDLVNRKNEFYPRGGLAQLRRGLKQLSKAGIVAILDHHALPGVQSPQQQFTGRCTTDVQFYTPYNYHRALIWTAVMTALSHIDPAFENVVAIEAVNEPEMDANITPGYGDFQKNFVQVVRAVEFLLGIPVSGLKVKAQVNANVTAAVGLTTQLPPIFSPETRSVLRDAIPILLKLGVELSLKEIFNFLPKKQDREPLITNFMDINWQHNNPANPADAAIGPQIYDNHLYYSFGGVADPNENAYLRHICNLDRIEQDAALGNSPLFFGEWGLPTQFQASDAFLRKWADAQKLAYSKDAGWIFWNFKIEISSLAGDTARQWSYLEGVRRGYLTKDPSKLLDPHVCDQYIRNVNTTASPLA